MNNINDGLEILCVYGKNSKVDTREEYEIYKLNNKIQHNYGTHSQRETTFPGNPNAI